MDNIEKAEALLDEAYNSQDSDTAFHRMWEAVVALKDELKAQKATTAKAANDASCLANGIQPD